MTPKQRNRLWRLITFTLARLKQAALSYQPKAVKLTYPLQQCTDEIMEVANSTLFKHVQRKPAVSLQ
jgi:hypothetical protein